MEHGYLRIAARLDSPLAGDAPQLDAIVEKEIARFHPKSTPGEKMDRSMPCPAPGLLPMPLVRESIGGWPVVHVSSPILLGVVSDNHDFIAKRIGVENANLLAEEERKVVSTTNSWTKSYRLPLRTRIIDSIVWFAEGNRREVLRLVRRVMAIGKKVSDGYGRIREWTVDSGVEPLWWFAPSPTGRVLMRPLPRCSELPHDLVGYRLDYGACCPPYWHPSRYGEIVVPS